MRADEHSNDDPDLDGMRQLLVHWEAAHGPLSPAFRLRFLDRPELRQIARYPMGAAKLAVDYNKKLNSALWVLENGKSREKSGPGHEVKAVVVVSEQVQEYAVDKKLDGASRVRDKGKPRTKKGPGPVERAVLKAVAADLGSAIGDGAWDDSDGWSSENNRDDRDAEDWEHLFAEAEPME